MPTIWEAFGKNGRRGEQMIDFRTDLAREAAAHLGKMDGIETHEAEKDGVTRFSVRVKTQKAAKALGRPQGEYVTLSAEDREGTDRPEVRTALSRALADTLSKMLPENAETLLVLGLGNAKASPDALGPIVAERILITRHLIKYLPCSVDPRLKRKVAALSPGVLGTTGIETAATVKGVCATLSPDAVIAVDALCCADPEAIGRSVQIADSGIRPGSGLGRMSEALDENALGCPVIAVGMPTVVYASDVVRSVLTASPDEPEGSGREAAIGKIPDRLKDAENMILTPKNVDEIIDRGAAVIADGIDLALHRGLPLSELRALLT